MKKSHKIHNIKTKRSKITRRNKKSKLMKGGQSPRLVYDSGLSTARNPITAVYATVSKPSVRGTDPQAGQVNRTTGRTHMNHVYQSPPRVSGTIGTVPIHIAKPTLRATIGQRGTATASRHPPLLSASTTRGPPTLNKPSLRAWNASKTLASQRRLDKQADYVDLGNVVESSASRNSRGRTLREQAKFQM